MIERWPRAVVALLAAAGASSAAVASASPLEDSTVGTAVFTGITEPHATSIGLNPAALALSGGGWHVFTQVTGRVAMLDVNRAVPDPGGGESSLGITDNVLAPGGMIALFGEVGERAYIGFAFGLPVSQTFSDAPGFDFHTRGGSLLQAHLTVAGTFNIAKRLNIGIGVSLAYSRLRLKLARDTALEAGTPGITGDCGGSACGFENPEATQEIEVIASTQLRLARENVGAILGAVYEVRPEWRVALSIVAPPGTYTDLPLRGDARVANAPRDGGDTVRGDAEVKLRLPESVTAGVRGTINRQLDVLANVRWQNASRHRQLDIRLFGRDLEGQTPEWYPRLRGFRDTIRVQAGVERRLGYPIRYGARLRVESGAVKPSRLTPLQVESWSVGAGVGGEIRLAEHIVLQATYDIGWYPGRAASPSAFDPNDRLDCVDSMFDVNACAAARDGRATPSAAGDYSRLDHGATFSIRYDSL